MTVQTIREIIAEEDKKVFASNLDCVIDLCNNAGYKVFTVDTIVGILCKDHYYELISGGNNYETGYGNNKTQQNKLVSTPIQKLRNLAGILSIGEGDLKDTK